MEQVVGDFDVLDFFSGYFLLELSHFCGVSLEVHGDGFGGYVFVVFGENVAAELRGRKGAVFPYHLWQGFG